VSFSIELPVRFQDVDAGGVLFFGRIYDYCHHAYEEFWGAEGIDRAHFFAGAPFLVPIAHSEADYRRPIRHGDRISVRIDVTRVGRASFTLRYHVTGPEQDLRVEASTVHAFVNRDTMRPIPIPEDLRAILLRHLLREPAPNLAT
jgi:1,4-dihydroxy-2-naphthoyl-CoA hydrolase